MSPSRVSPIDNAEVHFLAGYGDGGKVHPGVAPWLEIPLGAPHDIHCECSACQNCESASLSPPQYDAVASLRGRRPRTIVIDDPERVTGEVAQLAERLVFRTAVALAFVAGTLTGFLLAAWLVE